jgi:ParB-like nuclease family protein
MKLALKDVLPNPYCDLVGYRYLEYKIEKLMESIRATGYWDNTVGRILPDNKLQIAYGHHRLEALRRLYPPDSEHEFIVKDLSNDAMMQMMARENDETYGGDLRALMQNVAAVVQVLATGELSPGRFRIPENTRHEKIRYAPSYTEGIEPSVNRRAHAYTVTSVASYLGYTHEDRARGVRPVQKVQAALNVLELIELGFYRKEQLNDPRYQNDRGIVKVKYVLGETRDIRAKVTKTLARAQRETAAATEQVRIMQERIEAQSQLQLKQKAAEEEEVRKPSELSREANEKQAKRLVRAAHARRSLMARQEEESKKKAQALEKQLAEKKKLQAEAEKREREARAAAALYVSEKEWEAQKKNQPYSTASTDPDADC